MNQFDRILGRRILEVREWLLPRGEGLHDARGFVVLDAIPEEPIRIIELTLQRPDELSLVVWSDAELDKSEPSWRQQSYVCQHSEHCAGRRVIDLIRTNQTPYLGLLLDDQTVVYMDCDVGDGLYVFHWPLSGWYIDPAFSWITGRQVTVES